MSHNMWPQSSWWQLVLSAQSQCAKKWLRIVISIVCQNDRGMKDPSEQDDRLYKEGYFYSEM